MKSATKIILSNYTSKRFYSFARSLRSEYIWGGVIVPIIAIIIMFISASLTSISPFISRFSDDSNSQVFSAIFGETILLSLVIFAAYLMCVGVLVPIILIIVMSILRLLVSISSVIIGLFGDGDSNGYIVEYVSSEVPILTILISLVICPVLFNSMMIIFRRIHDLGLSILFLFVSPALYIMAENIYRFVEDPDNMIKNTLQIIAGAISLILWLMMMFKRGVIADNKFGEDPLGG